MKVWAIKASWIKICLVSDKRYGITITKLLVLVVKQCLLHNVAENINKNVQKQERKIIKNEEQRAKNYTNKER